MSGPDQMDDVDRLILEVLQNDASISNVELSKKAGLSPSACLARTRKMKERGIIRGFATLIDEKAVGLGLLAFTFVNLSPHNRAAGETFVKEVLKKPEVLECYNITGAWDYLLKIAAVDIANYRNFLMDELLAIPGVQRVETDIVLHTEKQSWSLPLA
jgi:Lrp/AsnC family transcriptional regulator